MSRTTSILARLRRYESRNVTFVDPAGAWPIVWSRARGTRVWDAEGREFLDLTAAFGVCAAGHANPRVVRAGQRQLARLPHAMGDVHPHPLKAELAEALSRLTFERWRGASRGKVIFCNSGFEAVEAGLKTALLATGKPGVVAFQGAYHGLGYGALTTTHRAHFRRPFRAQLARFARFVPFPTKPSDETRVARQVEELLRGGRCGAVLVEPLQARGGMRIPPPRFLPALRRLCTRHGALLIVDEVFTGFGRTGAWFGCEHTSTVPDVICLGKALTGGFPLSACVGRAELMDAAWPEATGEAIHTSTFLGHPVGCAMALAQVEEIRRRHLVERSAELGAVFLQRLQDELRGVSCGEVRLRGQGLMVALELLDPAGRPATSVALACVKRLLQLGVLVLPEGEAGNVLAITPPLVITHREVRQAARALAQALSETAAAQAGRGKERTP